MAESVTINSTQPHLPPGPDTPYDLNTTAACFEQLAPWVAEYPDIFCLTQVKRKDKAYLVNNPDYLKHIFISNHEAYQKGVGFERVKLLLGNGIITSDGPFWRRQRRMIQPAFGKDVIAKLTDEIKQLNLKLLEQWHELAKQNAVINITEATNELALNIILRSIFTGDVDKILEEHGHNPFAILTDSSARDLKLAVKFRALTTLVGDLIKQRRDSLDPDRIDFLNIFIQARDKETGEPMTDKEMIDEIMTLIVAGSETSATTMNWVWYSLSQHPEVEAKLQHEVDNASYDLIPGFDNVEELGYTRQVVEEVLRLYPPVWLYTRKAIKQDKLGDYDVLPGTDIFISPYYLHRRADLWPNPEKFDPERFQTDAVKQRHRNAYIPFSAGPRRCIGDFFAILEAQVHFGLMCRHFTLSYVNDYPIELEPEVNLRTRHPINMRIHHRS